MTHPTPTRDQTEAAYKRVIENAITGELEKRGRTDETLSDANIILARLAHLEQRVEEAEKREAAQCDISYAVGAKQGRLMAEIADEKQLKAHIDNMEIMKAYAIRVLKDLGVDAPRFVKITDPPFATSGGEG